MSRRIAVIVFAFLVPILAVEVAVPGLSWLLLGGTR